MDEMELKQIDTLRKELGLDAPPQTVTKRYERDATHA
jgi:hypothetical protein